MIPEDHIWFFVATVPRDQCMERDVVVPESLRLSFAQRAHCLLLSAYDDLLYFPFHRFVRRGHRGPLLAYEIGSALWTVLLVLSVISVGGAAPFLATIH